MPKTIEGFHQAPAAKYGIVVSRFNDFITKNLLKGCLQELARCQVKDKDIVVVFVPGSLEIPVAALALAKKKNIAAVICLGAVIRGETLHFELVAQNAARGIMEVSILTGKPVIFGVLSTDTVDQAYRRSGVKGGNKGVEAGRAAVEMASCLKKLRDA